jgi:hypothetical protein
MNLYIRRIPNIKNKKLFLLIYGIMNLYVKYFFDIK